MNAMPEVETFLKQLKLSGITETLLNRNKEAIESKLSHLEFLTLLLQDEVLRRENKKLAQRMKRANFKGEKTIERFDFAFNPKIDVQQIKDLASCRFLQEKVNILMVGPCGTCKSHIAQAIGHSAVRRGVETLFIKQTSLLSQLQAAKAVGSYERKLKYFVKIPLLIMDDFGLKPLRTPQDEDMHELVSERYEQNSTILTSNLDFAEWGEAFPNKLLGAATIDRLKHGAYLVDLDGPSYRDIQKTNKK